MSEEKKTALSIQVPAEEVRLLQEMCQAWGMSQTAVCRKGIRLLALWKRRSDNDEPFFHESVTPLGLPLKRGRR